MTLDSLMFSMSFYLFEAETLNIICGFLTEILLLLLFNK